MSEIVVSILEDFLDTPKKHSEDKGQIAFNCPACAADKGIESDGKGNLEINYFKGVFKCWACGQYNDMSGPLDKLIKKFGNKDHLKEYYLVKPEAREVIHTETVVNIKLPTAFKPLIYPKKLDPDYHEAIKYLKGRGIGLDKIARYNIGYTPNDKKDKDSGRVIIPSYDADGKLNYYTGRAYNKFVWPKYNNPDLDKKQIIYNEGKINWDATIYLVEGPFDHIVIPNSIPLLGKYISDILFFALLNKAKCGVVIVLDADAENDIEYLNKKLNINQLYGRVKVTYLPEEYDIAEIHQNFGAKGVLTILRGARRLPESSNYAKVSLKKF